MAARRLFLAAAFLFVGARARAIPAGTSYQMTSSATFTAAGVDHSGITSLALDTDGTIVAAGWTKNHAFASWEGDAWLARYDQGLRLLSSATYSGGGHVKNVFISAKIGPDRKIWVAGLSHPNPANFSADYMLAAYDSNFELLGSSLIKHSGGASYLGGVHALSGGGAVYSGPSIFRFDSNVVFVSSIPAAIGAYELTGDGGDTLLNAGGLGAGAQLLKYNSSLTQTASWSEAPSTGSYAGVPVFAPDGTVWLGGRTDNVAWMRRFDASLNQLNFQTYVGAAQVFGPRDPVIAFDTNRSVWIAGHTSTSFWIARHSLDFTLVSSATFQLSPANNIPQAALALPDGSIVIGGMINANGSASGDATAWLGKFSDPPNKPGSPSAIEVGTGSVHWTWSPSTAPFATAYRLYRSSSSDPFAITTSTSFWDSGLSSNTAVSLTIRAQNGAGLSDPSVSGSTQTAGVAVSSTTVAITGAAQTVSLSAPFGTVSLEVPSGGLAAPTVTLQYVSSFPDAGSAVGTMRGVGVGVDIEAGGTQPTKPIALSIGYRSQDAAGHDPRRFIIGRYDPVGNRWVPLISQSDPSNQRVHAVTDHFSLFQILAVSPASSLSSPRAFPNPLRPSQGHTGISITSIPADARVRIFTVLGEKVRELQASAAGIAFWDGRNAHGALVASGGYYALIQSGDDKTITRLAVER